MPIAAVPAYLGTDFSAASPGLRFGMYLKLWGINRRTGAVLWQTHDLKYEVRGQDRQEREIKEENKTAALRSATTLTRDDKATMAALLARQRAAFSAAGNEHARLSLTAKAIAPFTTGLGNEHPLENGFAFLNPYGLPYLPGSGVKGVLRQAAHELASGEWGDSADWTEERIHQIKVGRQLVDLSPIDALFGREPTDGESEHVRGALCFWDVIPQIEGNSLAVDIMTPHQSHYYQQKKDRKAGNSNTPHDSGAPNPISFLTVPPGAGFTFLVSCDLAHLERLAPDLAANGRWQHLITAALQHAFEWLGFGAKTAVGYGAMQVDAKAQALAAQAQRDREAAAAHAARLATMTPNQQQIDAFIAEFQTKHEQFPTFREAPNAAFHNKARALAKAAHEGTDWSADEKRAAADAIEAWLPKLVKVDIKDERKKLKLNALRGLA
ncbi:type III-B CRISPR module RAMP protein Cmr6 [Niveibacterium sp. 24ML]|uniref:type III-B CRISPR module RAMP protein Cmr6 n=1 Tax=Niveibacterium sp. 24ML TaxID=2985512 RepID=UPI00226DC870|nr:type III-B CRISPR module RAMP protein Cmr6 [Niveibacterium sp. 24ML]MCX9157918.1 type III-B CRISPR module RAMP protein Cmr6 [Niveibacterium sp. 24ML]